MYVYQAYLWCIYVPSRYGDVSSENAHRSELDQVESVQAQNHIQSVFYKMGASMYTYQWSMKVIIMKIKYQIMSCNNQTAPHKHIWHFERNRRASVPLLISTSPTFHTLSIFSGKNSTWAYSQSDFSLFSIPNSEKARCQIESQVAWCSENWLMNLSDIVSSSVGIYRSVRFCVWTTSDACCGVVWLCKSHSM